MWVPQPFQGFLLESSTHGLCASPESSQILARKVTHKSSTALWEMVQVSTASLKSAVSSGRLHSAHPVLVTLLGWKTITVQNGSYSGKKWEVTNRKTRRNFQGKRLWSPESCQQIPSFLANAIGLTSGGYLESMNFRNHRLLDDPWDKSRTNEYKWKVELWLSWGEGGFKESVLVPK